MIQYKKDLTTVIGLKTEEVAMSQGMKAASRSWKRVGNRFSTRAVGKVSTGPHSISLVKTLSDV